MVSMGGRRKGVHMFTLLFHVSQLFRGLAHMENASFLGPSINPSLCAHVSHCTLLVSLCELVVLLHLTRVIDLLITRRCLL